MSKSDYSPFSRLLHRMALQSDILPEVSFDIENAVVNKKDKSFADNHVFVSGLARSGTTILMRYLYETGLFRSLTYQDMPFVLMPNTWKKMSVAKNTGEYKERAHKDGIMVGFDSPEALDEVFWRVFCGRDYIFKDRLAPQRVKEATLKKFKDYVANILLSAAPGQTRYLSKNNNNVLRLGSLQQCFPASYIIIPFRKPLQHSLSLLSQHQHFSKIQAGDSFSLEYMNWLGHFEFGLNQKPFFLGDEKIFAEMERRDKNDIDFWLLGWKNYYQYVAGPENSNQVFFNYDLFCSEPGAIMQALFEKLNIDSPPIKVEPFSPPVRLVDNYDKNLLEECMLIYARLIAKALN
jgi:hypothetical protein